MPKGILDILKSFSESQLAGLVKAKKLEVKREEIQTEIGRLGDLLRRKTSELASVERKIRKMLGAKPKGRPRGRRRKSPGPTLVDAIVNAMSKRTKPLSLTEITKAVLDGGYRTKSAFQNFRTSVAHSLSRMKSDLVRKGEGYLLKLRKAGSPRSGNSRVNQGSSSTSQ